MSNIISDATYQPHDAGFYDEIQNDSGLFQGGDDEIFDTEFTEDELEVVALPEDIEHYSNLAPHMDDEELKELASRLCERFDNDESSCSDWIAQIDEGYHLLGISPNDTEPLFEGSSDVIHPLLIKNVLTFQSKASDELAPTSGPVKTRVFGKTNPQKEQQAKRIAEHMNYQITELMDDWFPETEKMLFHLAWMGSAFKKVYYDPYLKRPTAKYVSGKDLIINYHTSDLKTASMFTHRYIMHGSQIKRLISTGFFNEIKDIDQDFNVSEKQSELQEPIDEIEGRSYSFDEDDDVHTIYEIYVLATLDTVDPLAPDWQVPYVVTIHAETEQVLSVRRDWSPENMQYERNMTFAHYRLFPGPGFYGIGYMHMLRDITRVVSNSINQMMDAGSFANLPAGFKSKGLRIVGGDDPLSPGEWRDVQAIGTDLKNSLLPLPYKGADATLYQLTTFLIAEGQNFADSTEQIIQDAPSYGPVGTIMALLESGGKLYQSAHKRLHIAQKEELKILGQINKETITEPVRIRTVGDEFLVSPQDYNSGIDIIPVSDPNTPSRSHRIAKANMAIQNAQADQTGTHNPRGLYTYMYNMLDPDLAEVALNPPPPQAQPADPVATIGAAVGGQPVGAFPDQDHKAHIAVYQSFLIDPSRGASPNFNPRVREVLLDLINRHMFMDFQNEMGDSAQVPAMAAERSMEITQRSVERQKAEMMGQAEAQETMAKIQETLAKVDKIKAETVKINEETKLIPDEMAAKILGEQAARAHQKEMQSEKLQADKEKELNKQDHDVVTRSLDKASRKE